MSVNDAILGRQLCYVDLEGHRLFFTDNYARQWGDDWEDRPYWCNAGEPYEVGLDGADEGTNEGRITVIFCQNHGLHLPLSWGADMPELSVQDFKDHNIPWLHKIGDRSKGLMPGTTLRGALQFLQGVGAEIFVPAELAGVILATTQSPKSARER